MRFTIALALTVLASGRAMTLAFIHRAGSGGVGDPPGAWLMPLVGDAAVGLAAVAVAVLLWRVRRPWVWTAAVMWSAIGTFDALAAFLVEVTTPWPRFFMIELFGRSMFFVAAALQVAIIYLLAQPDVLRRFGLGSLSSGSSSGRLPTSGAF